MIEDMEKKEELFEAAFDNLLLFAEEAGIDTDTFIQRKYGDEAGTAESNAEGEQEIDLDAMDEDQLIEFADQQGIDVPRKCKTADQIREFIATKLVEAESSGGDAGGEGEGEQEIDLDAMDEDALLEFAEQQKIDIPRKCKTADEMRKVIAKHFEEPGEEQPAEKPGKKVQEPDEEEQTKAVREKLAAKAKAKGLPTKKAKK